MYILIHIERQTKQIHKRRRTSMIYYCELINSENEIIDIYGYGYELIVWGKGFVKTYPTNGPIDTKRKAGVVVTQLALTQSFQILNEEIH